MNAFIAAQLAIQRYWYHVRRAVFNKNLSASSDDLDIVYIINALRTVKRAGREANARRRCALGNYRSLNDQRHKQNSQ